MGFRVCFQLEDGVKHCIDLPLLVRYRISPDPDPWFNDIAILTSVVEVAGHLRSDELQKPVLEAATEGIRGLAAELPSGVELQHNERNFIRS